MRALTFVPFLVIVAALLACTTGQGNAGQQSENKRQCAGFGFQKGTDAFANCMMQLSMKQKHQAPPDHDALVRRYRNLSMRRQGDGRYPVCSASNMDAELDTSINKWVGPDCQMAPD